MLAILSLVAVCFWAWLLEIKASLFDRDDHEHEA